MHRTVVSWTSLKGRAFAVLLAVALIVALVGCSCGPGGRYELIIDSTEGGSVTVPGEGSFDHYGGTAVALVATPDEGYRFAGWIGDTDTIGDVAAPDTTILVDGHHSIRATFERLLRLTAASTAGGSVTAPGEGTFDYDAEVMVDLVATPDSGHRFLGWTGDIDTIGDADAPETTIFVDGNLSIIASFEPLVRLTVSGTAGGSITGPGVGTFCYEAGTVVDLAAAPATGYLFAGWTGDVDSIADVRSPATTIVMNDDHIIEAGFETYWIEIWDWHDLDAIRDDLEESYLLMTDLDATTPGYQELAGTNARGGRGWRPVADGYWDGNAWIGEVFVGNLHGQGYEIRGLVINRPEENIGLFGCVGTPGTIEAVGIVNADLLGLGIMGSLVAYNDGGTVNACYSSGSVRGGLDVGGLVGWNWGTVSDCYSTATVSSDNMAGGLMGWNSHILKSSYSAGSVAGGVHVGGLVGGNGHGGTISDCYSTADVYGQRYAAGLAGFNGYGASITRCYSTGSITGDGVIGFQDYGGLVGLSYLATVSDSFWDVESSGVSVSDGGTGKTTAQMMSIATYTDTGVEGLDAAWDIAAVAPGQTDDTRTWNIVDGGTYPFLGWEG
jgi:hypothetical protein